MSVTSIQDTIRSTGGFKSRALSTVKKKQVQILHHETQKRTRETNYFPKPDTSMLGIQKPLQGGVIKTQVFLPPFRFPSETKPQDLDRGQQFVFENISKNRSSFKNTFTQKYNNSISITCCFVKQKIHRKAVQNKKDSFHPSSPFHNDYSLENTNIITIINRLLGRFDYRVRKLRGHTSDGFYSFYLNHNFLK
ncbi:hypothetical protein GNY06_12920 [Elizabethkingia argentiflava]|uniref:Uncharacterized protein n=1 Tax=Elizabethkingia argenteiflava TaxID=2681556 RepID=A0A845PVI0_9FLAO|nr:hypothetical protein [Elizabethkingia argenteiflava]NAW52239.1 hypothetical protein [Elizabethkingia argenteiflava]